MADETQQAEAPKIERRTDRGSDTVVVACKLPNGLHMRLFRMVKGHEQLFGGGVREIMKPQATGEAFVLKGTALDIDVLKRGHYPRYPIEGGYALTEGVPRAFWERWLEQNADTALVREGLVFAASSVERGLSQAAEQAEVRSGLEPIDPDNPGKHNPEFRRITRDLNPSQPA